MNYEQLLKRYPKIREELPEEYKKIFEEHYKNNRTGATTASSISQRVERWLHKKVANDARQENNYSTLEIGAGTLNQLEYEKKGIKYDIVEPFEALYLNSMYLSKIDKIYRDISEVSKKTQYDRIISIATFEHICNLPEVVNICYALLKADGTLRISIPNEGRFLWRLAYKISTGREFKRNYGLDYEVLMKYEHVNTADEIEQILKYHFKTVKCSFLGIGKTFSFYRYYECKK